MNPSDALKIRAYGLTDRGLMRDENEDNLFMDEFRHVFAVADGLGGLPEGSRASTVAVTRLRELVEELGLDAPLNFQYCVDIIQQAVCEAGKDIADEIGMATTLTIAQIIGKTLRIGHVGDSGVFLYRDHRQEQLTVDHTMAQDIIDRMHASERVSIPEYYHHTLTRCVGQTGDIDVDIYEYELHRGDRLLLYTDGVTKTWKDSELTASFNLASEPAALAHQIIDVANQRGGPDNITAIALFIE